MTAQMSTAEEVRALEHLDLEGLRRQWRRRYGPPPRTRSADLLRACLAWRLQAAAFGGLEVWVRRTLRSCAEAAPEVGAGVRIRKEWRGGLYEVDRVEGGYCWSGKVYPSLSAAAQAITGVKRNGPRFFGLREEAGA